MGNVANEAAAFMHSAGSGFEIRAELMFAGTPGKFTCMDQALLPITSGHSAITSDDIARSSPRHPRRCCSSHCAPWWLASARRRAAGRDSRTVKRSASPHIFEPREIQPESIKTRRLEARRRGARGMGGHACAHNW